MIEQELEYFLNKAENNYDDSIAERNKIYSDLIQMF